MVVVFFLTHGSFGGRKLGVWCKMMCADDLGPSSGMHRCLDLEGREGEEWVWQEEELLLIGLERVEEEGSSSDEEGERERGEDGLW